MRIASAEIQKTPATTADAVRKDYADAHINRTDNPHSVTAAQVSAVPLTRTVNGKELSANIILTPADVAAEPANANLTTHLVNYNNPHTVTKTQVGLGNVDNTSDANKPVSTAQQTALNNKEELFPGFVSSPSAFTITIDQANRTVSISPTGNNFQVCTGGVLRTYTTTQTTTPAFTDSVGTKYVFFGEDGVLTLSTIAWTLLLKAAPVCTFYWNGALAEGSRVVQFVNETHPNTWPLNTWRAHHLEEGASWESGFSAYFTTTTGAPNVSGVNTCIGLSGGVFTDESQRFTVENSTGGLAWQQDLGVNVAANITVSNGLLADILYKDSTGTWTRLPATRFPFHWNSGNNRPQYVTSAGTVTDVGDNQFMVNWVCVVGDDRTGKSVFIVPHYVTFTTLALAQGATWSQLTSTLGLISSAEVKPLYMLIHRVDHTAGGAYNVAVKYAGLQGVIDVRLRGAAITASGALNAAAGGVSFVPTTTLTPTNVQAALEDLDTRTAYRWLGSCNADTFSWPNSVWTNYSQIGSLSTTERATRYLMDSAREEPILLPEIFTVPAGTVGLRFTVKYKPEATADGTKVAWKIRYVKTTDDVAWGSEVEVSLGYDTLPSANQYPQVYTVSKTLGDLSLVAGDVVQLWFARDATNVTDDTFGSDVGFTGLVVEAY